MTYRCRIKHSVQLQLNTAYQWASCGYRNNAGSGERPGTKKTTKIAAMITLVLAAVVPKLTIFQFHYLIRTLVCQKIIRLCIKLRLTGNYIKDCIKRKNDLFFEGIPKNEKRSRPMASNKNGIC